MDDTSFNYDESGNRSSVIDTGTDTYATNVLNQYNSAGSDHFDYDSQGNMTFDGSFNYSYDVENRMTEVARPGDGNSELNVGVDTTDLVFTHGGDASWALCEDEYYHDGNDIDTFMENHDCVISGDISNSQTSWFETTVTGTGRVYLDTPQPGVLRSWSITKNVGLGFGTLRRFRANDALFGLGSCTLKVTVNIREIWRYDDDGYKVGVDFLKTVSYYMEDGFYDAADVFNRIDDQTEGWYDFENGYPFMFRMEFGESENLGSSW